VLKRELLHVCLEAQFLQFVREPLCHRAAPLFGRQIRAQTLLELMVLLAEGRGELYVLAVVEHFVRVRLQRVLGEVRVARDSLVCVTRE
jgi:hypothetical protein